MNKGITYSVRDDNPNAKWSTPTCLYRHFDEKGNLLYVGVSLSVMARLSQHRSASEWFGDIARVEIEHHPNRGAALEAEKKAIREEKPKHNIAHADAAKPQEFNSRYAESRLHLLQRIVHFRASYTLDEAASETGFSREQLRAYIKAGVLSSVLLSRKTHIRKDEKEVVVEKRIITGWQLIDFLELLESSNNDV